MNANRLRRIFKSAILIGLCGVGALVIYASTVGGARALPVLYYLFVTFIVVGVIGVLGPRWMQFNAAVREGEKRGAIAPRQGYLFWLGLLFCALPVVWLFALSKTLGGPSQVNPMVAYIPSIGSLVLGIFLLFYSYYAWLKAVRSLQNDHRNTPQT